MLSVTSHAQEVLHAAVQQRLVYQLWASVAQQLVANLMAVTECSLTGVITSLSSAGRSQISLDCHFMVALYDLAHRAEPTSPIATDERSPKNQRPIEWGQLLFSIDATTRAEGTVNTAYESAEKMWNLLCKRG